MQTKYVESHRGQESMVSLEAGELGEQVAGTDVCASSSETMGKQQTD